MLKNKKVIIAAVLLIVALSGWYFYSRASANEGDVSVIVKKGEFEIEVVTSGELEAKTSKDIEGPTAMRSLGIWQVKIENLVPEGSAVKKGDFIAELDKTEIATKIKDAQSELEKTQSQYEQIRLDTTLTLRQARDELNNLNFQVKEKQIIVEQSTYEPPATIRQVNLDMEKTKKSMEQTEANYLIKRAQSVAKMQEITASLNQTKNKLDNLMNLMAQFTITAPESGMVIYERDWNGKKKVVGATISAWEPTVATLPDLNTMISKTYVNEVDIRKLKVGQMVDVSLDAFPEKKLTGKVTQVANVGEQMPKYDSKVFEVIVQVNEKDTTLRPAMTTSNKIIVGKMKNVLSVPLDAVHTADSSSFVYIRSGMGVSKKQIKTGAANENSIIVTNGLTEGDEIFLNIPKGAEDKEMKTLAKK
ncbi:MAG: efflux RND transporter periplasmic adaptor subunit [Bacteroidia bacterium]